MNVFFAYAHSERSIAQQLETQLNAPIRAGKIKIWHRDKIAAGSRISLEITRQLAETQVVVFFLSAEFLASDFYYEIESEVVRLAEKGKVRLMPVLAKPCLWEQSQFNSLNVGIWPRSEKAITSATPAQQEELLLEISQVLLALNQPNSTPSRSIPSNISEIKQDKAVWVKRQKELLAQNKVEKVFDELDKVLENNTDSEIHNLALLLKSRYSRAKRDQYTGIVSNENYQVENSKILYSLLSLLDEIPDEFVQTSLEESYDYLETVRSISDFSEEDKKYKDIFVQLRDKQQEIDEILVTIEKSIDLSKVPNQAKKFQNIEQQYNAIRTDIEDEQAPKNTEKKLDEIRQELIGLVEIAKQEESKVAQKTAEEEKGLSGSSNTVYLNEIKLIFVGDGEAGKTTLLENLRDSNYKLKKHASTHGLEVKRWEIPVYRTPGVDKVLFNVWDFGGQGHYRAIQQFFSTPKALYLYVTTPQTEAATLEDEYSGLDYWLNFIQLLGFDTDDEHYSPVVFVMNKCDIGGNQLIDENKIKANFKGVKNFIHVSCKTGQGLEELRQAIEQRLTDTRMMNRSFPRTWMKAKAALAQKKEAYDVIDYRTYLDVFKENVPFTSVDQSNIEEEVEKLTYAQSEDKTESYLADYFSQVQYSLVRELWKKTEGNSDSIRQLAEQIILEQKAQLLIQYLHTTGHLLYFSNVPSLQDKLILRPDWARKFIYDLFSSPYAASGLLKRSDLVQVFPGEVLKRTYSIDLLQHYNLCYSEIIAGEETYFIPSLFPQEQPTNWLGLDAMPVTVTYECTFTPLLPAEFLPRLIARMFKYISENNTFWKKGVLFDQPASTSTTYALALEHWKDKKITIAVVGEDWAALLADLANSVFEIITAIKDHRPNTKLSASEALRFHGTDQVVSLDDLRSLGDQKLTADQLTALMPATNPAITEPDINTTPKQTIADVFTNVSRRLFFLSACPADKTELRMNREYASMTRVLLECRKEKEIELIPKLNVEGVKLLDELSVGRVDYIHFSLHGSRSGYLFFIKENKQSYPLDKEELIDVFDEVLRTGAQIKLVCFSACHSLTFAQSLAAKIPYTIGMDGAFPVEAAELFAKVFMGIGLINVP